MSGLNKLMPYKFSKKIKNKIISEYALLSFFITLSFSETIAEFFLVICFIFFIKEYKRKKINPLNKKHYFSVLVFLFFCLLSTWKSPTIIYSLKIYVETIIKYFVAYLCAAFVAKENGIEKSLLTISGMGVITSFIGFSQALFTRQIANKLWTDVSIFSLIRFRLCSTWGNPNIFAGFLLLCISIILGLINFEKNRSKKFIFYLFLAIMAIALIFTFSRGAWLAFIILICIILLITKKKKFFFF